MVIDDLDIVGSTVVPAKTHAPLLVDANVELVGSAAAKERIIIGKILTYVDSNVKQDYARKRTCSEAYQGSGRPCDVIAICVKWQSSAMDCRAVSCLWHLYRFPNGYLVSSKIDILYAQLCAFCQAETGSV